MRGKTLLALMLLGLSALSGCLGFGEEETDDDHVDECDALEGAAHDECHDDGNGGNGTGTGTGNGGNGNDTVPNIPPVAMLTMTDSAGNPVGNGSAIMAGESVTFSANGSMDADGQLELAALTVFDKNGSRTISLIENGQLVDTTLVFEHNGFLIASLRVLDDDGDAAAAADVAWVNIVQSISGELTAVSPGDPPVEDCAGPGAGLPASTPLLDSSYSAGETFQTFNGTSWISAVATGDVEITICGPDGNKVSEGGPATSVSTPMGSYPASVFYYVFVQATDPQAEYTIDVIAHWEAKPTA